MMKNKLLLCVLASLILSGCVTYTSEYANDGYYSSPRDSYNDYGDDYYGNPDSSYDDYGYAGDGYYGSTGNYGQYSYGSGGYSSISFTFNFGPSYSHYRNYPSYYGYYQCSPWSAYCYSAYNPNYGSGWGYTPYYVYHHHHHEPKPKPPKHQDDHPKQNPGQPGLHPGYPIVDRADGPRPRQPQYRPVNSVPQQQGQTQPIANGGTPNTPQYPRQQLRPRPITLPISDGKERERYAERESMPRQQQNYPQRPQQRARPAQSEQPNNDYARFPQAPRNAPVQQGQAPRNRPPNNQHQVNAAAVVAQQMPQQRAQPRPQPERRERVESKQREPKVERDREDDKP